jgi:2-phospho-L-lactate guanylyltransferase
MKAKSPKDFEPIHAIVPLNVPKKSKLRLSKLLRPIERAQLTIAMLSDVLSALRGSPKVSSITVVSADEGVQKIARTFGADFVWEGERRALNRGLRIAIDKSQRKGASAALVVHADLPFLTSREVDRFLAMSRGYTIALVPSKDRTGTNALLLKPPNIIQPAFGKGSFNRHLRLAEQKKLRCRVVRLRGISFDLDVPRDLQEMMRHPIQNATFRFLCRLKSRSGPHNLGRNTSRPL